MAKQAENPEPVSGAALNRDIDIAAITAEQIKASQGQTKAINDLMESLKAQSERTDTTAKALELVGAAFAAMQANIPPREIKEGDPEWNERLHKEGFYDDFFGVTVLQNAYEAQARGLSEEVRRRASKLTAGQYIKDKYKPGQRVTVSVEKGGSLVRISYPIKGDEQHKNRDHWNDFSDLVNKIWDEMQVVTA